MNRPAFAPAAGPLYTSRVMNSVRRTRFVYSAFCRAAISIFAAAQLCLALASFSEGRFGTDARAHVEAAGTSVHHAHDEGSCAACTARALFASFHNEGRPFLESTGRASVIASQVETRPDFTSRSDARPRAPPVRQA